MSTPAERVKRAGDEHAGGAGEAVEAGERVMAYDETIAGDRPNAERARHTCEDRAGQLASTEWLGFQRPNGDQPGEPVSGAGSRRYTSSEWRNRQTR